MGDTGIEPVTSSVSVQALTLAAALRRLSLVRAGPYVAACLAGHWLSVRLSARDLT